MIFKIKESVWVMMSNKAKTGFYPGDKIMLTWEERISKKGLPKTVERYRVMEAPII